MFDVTQYKPKSWMNRNRVLHPAGGWMYVTVPLAHSSQNLSIAHARVHSLQRAHAATRGKLSHYRRHAPYYDDVLTLVDNAFADSADDSLVHHDIAGLRAICQCLGLRFEYCVLSETDIALPDVTHAGGWAPAVAAAFGADEYVNPVGGRALFDPSEFAALGVALSFLEMPPLVYDTGPYGFEPSLSILDALMWLAPQEVVAAMTATTLVLPTS